MGKNGAPYQMTTIPLHFIFWKSLYLYLHVYIEQTSIYSDQPLRTKVPVCYAYQKRWMFKLYISLCFTWLTPNSNEITRHPIFGKLSILAAFHIMTRCFVLLLLENRRLERCGFLCKRFTSNIYKNECARLEKKFI